MAGHPQLALQPGDSGSMVQMAHRNRWFTFLNSMVIFHGEVLVITRCIFFKPMIFIKLAFLRICENGS